MAKEAKVEGLPVDGPSRLVEELRERTETAKGGKATKYAAFVVELADYFVDRCRAKADDGETEHFSGFDAGAGSLAKDVCAALVERGLPAELNEVGGSAAIVGSPVVVVRW